MQLKSCPFCGDEAAVGRGPDYVFVNCVACLASTSLRAEQLKTTEAEATEAWNMRYLDDDIAPPPEVA